VLQDVSHEVLLFQKLEDLEAGELVAVPILEKKKKSRLINKTALF